MGRDLLVHHIWILRIAPQEIGHGADSGTLFRDRITRAARHRIPHLPGNDWHTRLRSRRLVDVDLIDQHRRCHRRAASLVRIRCASSAADHAWLPPISVADRIIFSRRFSLSRTVHARSSHHLQFDLDRHRYLHLGSDHALALQSRATSFRRSRLRDAGLMPVGRRSVEPTNVCRGSCQLPTGRQRRPPQIEMRVRSFTLLDRQ